MEYYNEEYTCVDEWDDKTKDRNGASVENETDAYVGVDDLVNHIIHCPYQMKKMTVKLKISPKPPKQQETDEKFGASTMKIIMLFQI